MKAYAGKIWRKKPFTVPELTTFLRFNFWISKPIMNPAEINNFFNLNILIFFSALSLTRSHFPVPSDHLNIIVLVKSEDNLWRNPLKTTKIQYLFFVAPYFALGLILLLAFCVNWDNPMAIIPLIFQSIYKLNYSILIAFMGFMRTF